MTEKPSHDQRIESSEKQIRTNTRAIKTLKDEMHKMDVRIEGKLNDQALSLSGLREQVSTVSTMVADTSRQVVQAQDNNSIFYESIDDRLAVMGQEITDLHRTSDIEATARVMARHPKKVLAAVFLVAPAMMYAVVWVVIGLGIDWGPMLKKALGK